MSWDVFIFNSKQKINSVEEIDEALLIKIDFDKILEQHFHNLIHDDNHREVKGETYSINYFTSDQPESNKSFNLYGEDALFELIRIAKIQAWQIFDTGNGEMIDLNSPEKNGYDNFQQYLQQVLKANNNSKDH